MSDFRCHTPNHWNQLIKTINALLRLWFPATRMPTTWFNRTMRKCQKHKRQPFSHSTTLSRILVNLLHRRWMTLSSSRLIWYLELFWAKLLARALFSVCDSFTFNDARVNSITKQHAVAEKGEKTIAWSETTKNSILFGLWLSFDLFVLFYVTWDHFRWHRINSFSFSWMTLCKCI